MDTKKLVAKLTSRKFWLSIASFVSMIMIYHGAAENSATEVAAIIGAFGTIISYLFAEGISDAGNQIGGNDNGAQED